jgi:hypothetical protein
MKNRCLKKIDQQHNNKKKEKNEQKKMITALENDIVFSSTNVD